MCVQKFEVKFFNAGDDVFIMPDISLKIKSPCWLIVKNENVPIVIDPTPFSDECGANEQLEWMRSLVGNE